MGREEQLARIAQLERIKALESAPGSPGVAAMGNTEGPTTAAKKEWYDVDTEGLKETTIENLPLITAGVGSAVGSVVPGIGTIGGGAAGGFTGQALKSLIRRYQGRPETRGQFYTNLAKAPLEAANAEALGVNGPAMIKAAGERIYSSSIPLIELAAKKYGKEEVGKEMFKQGIKNPLTLSKKIPEIVDKLTNKVKGIVKKADEAGGSTDINQFVTPAQQYVDELRAIDTPEAIQNADKFQKVIDFYKEKTSASLEKGAKWKTEAYNEATDKAFEAGRRGTKEEQFYKSLGRGAKEAVETGVEKSIGLDQAIDVVNTNDSLGKLLSTGKAQRATEAQALRDLNELTSTKPGGTGKVVAATVFGLTGNPWAALKAIAIQKTLAGANLATMPVGYGVQKMAPMVEKAHQMNPWASQYMFGQGE